MKPSNGSGSNGEEAPRSRRAPRVHDVIVVGSGFAGLGMGIHLRRAGITDFVILERASDVGGTWRDNHYPGAACDIESHLYSFSFEPNPSWSHMFARQSEILAYLNRCADKYDLRGHVRFESPVVLGQFEEATSTWMLRTAAGEELRARAVVFGCGGLSRPSSPDIRGLEQFEGKVFHSARWDHGVDLKGARVGVIGTGASSIQIVPAIAPVVTGDGTGPSSGRLHVFQRTAPWIIPRPDRPIGERERAIYKRWPPAQKAARAALYLRHELFALGFVVDPRLMRVARKMAGDHIAASIADPALRAKVTPSYTIGCKRILLSNDYYPAIQRAGVELVTEPIDEVTRDGIRTRDGTVRPLDAIVLATGFEAAESCAPFEVRGRGGRDLNETWHDGAEAYLGTTVSGFPNLFMIVGPNTGLGHSSMVYMIESQIAYVMSCLGEMRRRGLSSVEVRRDVQTRYNASLHGRLAGTVWNSGCASWYRTRTGKNTTLWPGFTFEFRMRTRRFALGDYEVTDASATSSSPVRA